MAVRSGVWALLLVLGVAVRVQAALPPDIEADRLLLGVEQALQAEQFERAAELLQQLREVPVEVAAIADFYEGEVLRQQRQWDAARAAYERYLQRAGRESERYRDALQAINAIDVAQRYNASSTPPAKPQPLDLSDAIQPAQPDLVDNLKQLYLTDSAREALTLHLNSLLATHRLTRSKVRRLNVEEGVVYSVSTAGDGSILVSAKDYDRAHGGDSFSIHNSKLLVFGLNPLIRSGCSSATNSCWLINPADDSRWIEIDRDADAITAMAQTMTALMLTLQRRDNG